MEIPLFKVGWVEEDVDAIAGVIRGGKEWTCGGKTIEFEEKVAEYNRVKFATSLNSGTSALLLALKAYEVGGGNQVIVPAFTFIATANVVRLNGATPIFADIESDTYGLDYESVKSKITDNTKAIILVHYAGHPARDTKKIAKLAKRENLILVEDVAEAFGATINRKRVGSFGDVAALSFCQNKIITTGEGGAVLTNSEEIKSRIEEWRSHGRTSKNYFSSPYAEYAAIGYNLRMSDITAALGVSQLARVEEIIKNRIACGNYMSNRLNNEIRTPKTLAGFRHVYQLYSILVPKRRDDIIRELWAKGIGCKVYFKPIYREASYKGNSPESLPTTEYISSHIISTPIYPYMDEKEMDYVCGVLNTTVKKWN